MRVWDKKARIKGALRKLWLWSPKRTQTLRAARISRGLYQCFACKQLYGPKAVQVDHIVPIGAFDGWDGFIERLFEGELQVLCKPCHLSKKEHGRPSRAV